MQTRILFIATLVFCGIATAYLFVHNQAQLDPSAGKDWWTLSFADSRNENSFDITVTNYTSDASFHYAALAGNRVITEQDFTVAPGEQKVILIPLTKTGQDRMSIRVTHGQEIQTIYRQR